MAGNILKLQRERPAHTAISSPSSSLGRSCVLWLGEDLSMPPPS